MKTYIALDDILDLFIRDGELIGREILPNNPIKINHGSCCVCATCGYHYDECVCSHNDLLNDLNGLSKKEL